MRYRLSCEVFFLFCFVTLPPVWLNTRLQHNCFNVVLNVEILRYSCYGAVDRQFVRFLVLLCCFVVSWLKLKLQLVAGRLSAEFRRWSRRRNARLDLLLYQHVDEKPDCLFKCRDVSVIVAEYLDYYRIQKCRGTLCWCLFKSDYRYPGEMRFVEPFTPKTSVTWVLNVSMFSLPTYHLQQLQSVSFKPFHCKKPSSVQCIQTWRSANQV